MRTEQVIPRELEYKDVKFTAKISKHDNCCCDGCYRLGRVMKICVPETKHFDRKELRTIYSSTWLCENCLKLLKNAIENAEVEK